MLLAAGDTFRAAAIDQLKIWGERAGAGRGARAGRRSGRARLRRADAGAQREHRRCDRRHRRPAAEPHRADERAGKDGARDQARSSPTAPHAVLLVLDATVGPERAVAGRGVRQDGRRDRAGDDQARRHGARRHSGGARRQSSVCRCISSASARAIDDLQPFTARDFARAIAGHW